MSNSKLVGKSYPVPPEYQKYLGASISYPNLKMNKTRMSKSKDDKNFDEFKQRGGDETLKWIEQTLKTGRDAIYNIKKTGMDAGRENQFIKKHEKDKDNANPTAVGGLPKINKGNISRKIMSNKEVYNESISVELKQIIYLIEYMNNNKQKI
jgi:hypothetical protein